MLVIILSISLLINLSFRFKEDDSEGIKILKQYQKPIHSNNESYFRQTKIIKSLEDL